VRFHDRAEAGRALADSLQGYRSRRDVVVLALPRGGVAVGFELARALAVELDVYLVRKLGVPGREELAMGAIASDGTRVLNEDVVSALAITDETIARAEATETRELERRERLYRSGRVAAEIRDRTVILVDDGLATGATMRAAALAVRARMPARLVIAVPVAPREACDDLRPFADEVVCLEASESFRAVGAMYDDFAQTRDDEVRALLDRAAGANTATARAEYGNPADVPGSERP
jgi:putative phosphoribosyl transferase